jgi:CDP-diacylglycerol---serine O-phosphatidyltransferase
MKLKVADGVTFLSLVSSLFALHFAIQHQLLYAAIALLISVIFDFLDGKVARMMNQASESGMYLDSLTDIVAFGAIPVFIAFTLFGSSLLLIAASALYLAGGIYRLARFQTTKLKGEFQGMPITLNGIFVAVLLFFPEKTYFVIYFCLSTILMVSTIKVKKL